MQGTVTLGTPELELRDYLRIFWKRKWLIALGVAVCVGASVGLTETATPIYRADAKLFVGQRQITTAQLQEGVQVSQLSQQLLVTYAEIIRTTPIVERAVREADLPVNARTLVSKLKAEPIVDTQLLRVSYSHRDPAIARRTVNAVARAFVDEVEKIEASPTEAKEKPAIKVSVVQPALLPVTPTSPQPVRNFGMGAVLGLMLGLGIVFLVEYLDTTVKNKEDVEERLGLPVLASVPKIQMRRDELYLEGDNQSAFAETFRKLRTAIQLFGTESRHRTILVTSPHASEGKSTTAINLAAVYAYSGSRTVLVEADLRRPKLHEHFTIAEMNGFTLALLGRIPLVQAVLATSIKNLACIPAGAIPPNPVELLASDRMREIIEELHQNFETIIIDAPPILPVADASTIVPRVDGVLLVTRAKETRRDHLRESAELIQKVGGRLLGVVLNVVPQDLSDSAYSYYDTAVRPKGRRGRAGARR